MNDYKSKVLDTRNIMEEEYNLIINLLDKYKMDKTIFIKNAETLKLKKVQVAYPIINGYDSKENAIYYNDNSNLTYELLHAASSKDKAYQGILVKPNGVYKKTFGFGLNEGITDLFLECANKEEGIFSFEKICAKVLKYAYGNQIFNAYFQNNDGMFRHQFDKDITHFMELLDEYTMLMLTARQEMQIYNRLSLGLANAIKILMDSVIKELLDIVKICKKDYRGYLQKQLKSKTMKPIYDIIGEYEYKD